MGTMMDDMMGDDGSNSAPKDMMGGTGAEPEDITTTPEIEESERNVNTNSIDKMTPSTNSIDINSSYDVVETFQDSKIISVVLTGL